MAIEKNIKDLMDVVQQELRELKTNVIGEVQIVELLASHNLLGKKDEFITLLKNIGVVVSSEEKEELDLNEEVLDAGNLETCPDMISYIIKGMSSYPLFTLEEEVYYTKLYAETRDTEIRNKIMNHNLRLVLSLAKSSYISVLA